MLYSRNNAWRASFNGRGELDESGRDRPSLNGIVSRLSYHPCSPSSLAVAAVPRQASSELGADLCHLSIAKTRPSQVPGSQCYKQLLKSRSNALTKLKDHVTIGSLCCRRTKWRDDFLQCHLTRCYMGEMCW